MRIHPKISQLATDLSTELVRDERGTIGMMYSLSLLGVMMMIGCAVDIGRATQAKQGLTTALDAATIAAAKIMKDGTSTETDVKAMAQTYFDANVGAAKGIAKITNFKVEINKSSNTVTSTVESHVPTAFARVAGIDKIDLPISSTAMFNQQDIEVGLQLDVTGSMNESIKGKQKLASLKEASNDLFDILLPDGGNGTTKVRIGLAPFDAGVNLGTYASTVSGGTSTSCVYERQSASYDTTDDAPNGFAAFKSKAALPGAANCPANAKLVPLTDKKATLKAAVATMTPGESTAGHLGTSWAWNLISPKWSGIWPGASKPADYSDKGTMKVVVLMTDGIYNTVGGKNSKANELISQQKAKALCANMRDQHIKIYAVGFIKSGDPASAADTLIDCAGTNGSFYKAENGDELKAAFKAIAQDISRLRLTN